MSQTHVSTSPRTVADVMMRDVRTIAEDTPLSEATQRLARLGLREVPVIDRTGRCKGVLSVSDLARWAAGRGEGSSKLPRTCSFQEKSREVGGRETILCLLEKGVCPFQRLEETLDEKTVITCIQPHTVPTEWKIVDWDSAPNVVRDVMTNEVVSVELDAPVAEAARVMLDKGVHRVLVLDHDERPVGVVTVYELLRTVAYPESTNLSGL